LTAGWAASGAHFEPYGQSLADALQQLGLPCEVSYCGLSGFRATELEACANASVTQPDTAGRVGKGLAHILDSQAPPPDVVLIMAGTNDMAMGKDVGKALRSVRNLHQLCHARGVPTVALAPPFHDPRKKQLFAKLLSSWGRFQANVLRVIDPEELVPRTAGNLFWDADALHLTKAGYQSLGQSLAQILHPQLLHELNNRGSNRQPLQRPATRPQLTPPQTPRMAAVVHPSAASPTLRKMNRIPAPMMLRSRSPSAATVRVR